MVKVRLNDTKRLIFKKDYLDLDSKLYLIDTGAELSVYTRDLQELLTLYPDISNSGKVTIISGFGGDGECNYVPIYIIPKIELGGLTIHNLPVAVYQMNYVSVDLIIASNVLKHNRFTVDLFKRELEIDDMYSDIYCNLSLDEKDNSICKGVSVFVQEVR